MMKKQGAQTRVKTATTLSPAEEKVVRMRHGLAAPGDMELTHMGEGNPELHEKLAEMEARALSAVGARNNSAKRKIVNSLRRKD